MNERTLISVCVCTYKRMAGLEELLNALAVQGLEQPFEVVIVDNDAEGSARGIVDQCRERLPGLPIRYSIEPEQNIGLARNRSVAAAKGDWLAFIDDDEIPEPTWLSMLLACVVEYKADGAFAPVVPILPEQAPAWVRRGRFFERPRHRTGETIPAEETRTSNALISASLLKRRAQPFDPRYKYPGGEDCKLFISMVAEGARFVWCDEAVLYERVPQSRTNVQYLLSRTLRMTQLYAERSLATRGKLFSYGMFLRGLAALGLASVMAPLLLPFGAHRSVWWLRKGARGVAKLLVLTPFRYQRYRT